VSWRAVDPSPFRGWIRWAPRSWSAAPLAHLDLATHRLAWPAADACAGGLPAAPPDQPGLAYLPPVATEERARLAALALELAAAGSASAAHEGATGEPGAGSPAARWVDPLAAWLAGTSAATWRGAVSRRPAPLHVAVPLAAGLTPAGEELAAWLDAFAALSPAAVVGVSAVLTPADRRRLVERLGESSFEEIFHGAAPSEGDFARLVAAHGLRPLPARPALPGLSPRAARNQELSGALWEAAELALRLAAPEAECVALFAAARHLETSSLDISALAREGNLAVLGWLQPAARGPVEELLSTGASARLEALRGAWSGGRSA